MNIKIVTILLIFIFLCNACSMRNVKTGLFVGAGIALGVYVGAQAEGDNDDSGSECKADACNASPAGGGLILLFGMLGGYFGVGADIVTTPKEKKENVPDKNGLIEPDTVSKAFAELRYGR